MEICVYLIIWHSLVSDLGESSPWWWWWWPFQSTLLFFKAAFTENWPGPIGPEAKRSSGSQLSWVSDCCAAARGRLSCHNKGLSWPNFIPNCSAKTCFLPACMCNIACMVNVWIELYVLYVCSIRFNFWSYAFFWHFNAIHYFESSKAGLKCEGTSPHLGDPRTQCDFLTQYSNDFLWRLINGECLRKALRTLRM